MWPFKTKTKKIDNKTVVEVMVEAMFSRLDRRTLHAQILLLEEELSLAKKSGENLDIHKESLGYAKKRLVKVQEKAKELEAILTKMNNFPAIEKFLREDRKDG